MSRTLDWDGCLNVRDLGGLPLEEGGETRRGVLVRSDGVRKLSDVVHVSLFGTYDPDFRDGVEEFMAAGDPAGYWASSYIWILEHYKPQIVRALAAVADADGPVCFHCAGGKDRTGIVAALVLRLAGVPVAEVGADYALSAVLLAKESPAPDASARRRFMHHSSPESMRRAVEHVEREHGSVAGYLRACGLDEARIERLRERLRP